MAKPNIVLVHGAWGDGSHWRHVIPILAAKGYRISAVQNPLTSVPDDIDRTSKLAAAQDGPTLLVGHSYGGVVITGGGHVPNVVGLVYIAAFAPDEGESFGSILGQREPPAGAASIRPDKYGFLWIAPDKFHESFCQDLQPSCWSWRWPRSGPLLRGQVRSTGVENQAELVSDLRGRPDDSPGHGDRLHRTHEAEEDDQAAGESRIPCVASRGNRGID